MRKKLLAAGFVGATLVVAAFLPSSSQTAGRRWPAPRTLLEVPGLAAFAQDGKRIAWIDWRQPCQRLVRIRNLATKVTKPLLGRTGPTCDLTHWLGAFEPRMALAGERALWSYFTVSNSHYQIYLLTAAPGAKETRPGTFEVYGGFEDADHEPPLVPMAGDGRTLVFAGLPGEYSSTHAFRVTPRGSAVRGTELTSAVAASGRRFGVARHRPGWCRLCNLDPNWSPDGTKLAFLGRRRTTADDRRWVYELYVVDADGQNLRRLLPAGEFSIIGWSSDGTSVFYTDGSGIFSVDLAGQSQRLTSTSVDIVSPVLSADNLKVAFGRPGGELRVLGVSTGAEATVAVAPQGKRFDWIGWSPDGRTLGYLTGANQDRGAELRIVPSSGGPAALLATMDIRYPTVRWAPNGREIGFERADRISAVATDTLVERRVVSAGGFSGWSPDGASVAYWGKGQGDRVPLYVAAADGTNERLVGTSTYPYRQWAYWSPDSAELAFDADFRGTIHVAPASGAGERRLATGTSPIWSPTGARLAYVVPASLDVHQGGAVDVVNRDGSDARAVARALVVPDRFPVEIRTWKKGSVVAKFDARRPVEALALSGSRVALLTGTRVRKWLEIRRTNGRPLRTTVASRDVAPELGMAGRWVVFRTGRTIRVLDLRSGAISSVTRAGGYVVGLSIEDRRIAWGELRRGKDRIRTIVLPM